jgi:hypothetical protein
LTLAAALAAEKEGLRFEVVPKMLVDRSVPTNSAVFTTAVDQDMALKATIKNISMRDNLEGSIDYTVIVQHWSTETPTYTKYTGTQPLQAIRIGEQVELDIGQYHLGGHLHGTSEHHKDKLAAWKITVTEGDKKTEFTSGSNFGSLEKVAKPVREKRGSR